MDVHTTWRGRRGLPNRSEASVCGPLASLAAQLPFPLRGLERDNGGEFVNHQEVRGCAGRPPAVAFSRSRPDPNNDQAHVAQKNYPNVRRWFGSDRDDEAAVGPLVNALARGRSTPGSTTACRGGNWSPRSGWAAGRCGPTARRSPRGTRCRPVRRWRPQPGPGGGPSRRG